MTPAVLAWIERFRRYLSAERRCSPHTVAAYTRDLRALVSYCDRAGLESWAGIDGGHLRSFAARLHGAGLSPRSIQRRLSAVRSFYEFLQREGHALRSRARGAHPGGAAAERAEALERADREIAQIRSNPGQEVRAPKAARRLPETLDADQMARLLAIPAGEPFASRDRDIMVLLYSSGLRLA